MSPRYTAAGVTSRRISGTANALSNLGGANAAVAAAFYVLPSLALWVFGAGNLLAGARRRGWLTVGAGVATLLAWVAWALTGPFARPGLALPEIVGAAVFGGWAVWTGRDVRRRLGLA